MTSINTDLLDKYQINTPSKQDKNPNQLMQDDFLTLMTTQLKQQDPFKPTDNGEFLGQMAQFSTVSGLEDLQKSFKTLAESMQSNQALTAASLIGREALTEADHALLSADNTGISGSVELPISTGFVTVDIVNAAGEKVQRLDLGSQTAGEQAFHWDGKLADGSTAPPGSYRFAAQFATEDGATEAAVTRLFSKIESVSLNSGEIKLNTADGGSYDFSAIKQIH